MDVPLFKLLLMLKALILLVAIIAVFRYSDKARMLYYGRKKRGKNDRHDDDYVDYEEMP
jgi:hypothetical protein